MSARPSPRERQAATRRADEATLRAEQLKFPIGTQVTHHGIVRKFDGRVCAVVAHTSWGFITIKAGERTHTVSPFTLERHV